MSLSDVVNELHNQDSLADTSTAKETDLSSLGVWGKQVDDLNTGDENFLLDTHLNELGRLSVNGGALVGVDWTTLIDGLTNDVDDTAESLSTDGNTNGRASVDDLLATNQTLCSVHGDGTHGVLTQVLGNFQDQARGATLDFECVQDWWKIVIELDVDDGTDDSDDFTTRASGCLRSFSRIVSRYNGDNLRWKKKELESKLREFCENFFPPHRRPHLHYFTLRLLCYAMQKKIFSKFSYLSESYITSRVDIFKTLIFLARKVCNSLIADYFVAIAIDGIVI